MALMIGAPSAAAREVGRTPDRARPEITAAAVAVIVTAAMTALGTAVILRPSDPALIHRRDGDHVGNVSGDRRGHHVGRPTPGRGRPSE